MKKPSKQAARLVGCALFSSIICCGNSLADQLHYNNMLIGDRAAGMGGAYVAISDDPSGMYYNPAGLAYSMGSKLSASMNAFQYNKTDYKGALGGKDWTRTSSVLVPNFFGITQPLAGGYAGFSYAVTDAALEDQDQTFPDTPSVGTTFTINFNNQDTTYNIGPSFAFEIGDHWAVGLTMYGYYRTQERIFSQTALDLTDPDYTITGGNRTVDPADSTKYLMNSTGTVNTDLWQTEYQAITEIGARPMLGIMWSPVEKLSFGVSLSQVVLLSSERKTQATCYTTDWDAIAVDETNNVVGLCKYDQVSRATTTSNLKRAFPWQVDVGGAYFANSQLIVSGSMSVYQALYGLSTPLINYALGAEYYVTGQWAIRVGGYTNLANTPTIKAGFDGQPDHVDMFGGTFSVTNFTRNSSISVGVNVTAGTGQAQVVGDGQGSVQDVEMLSASGFLSTSYSY